MKTQILLPLIAASALSACTAIYVPTLKEIPVTSGSATEASAAPEAAKPAFRLSSRHWTDVAKLKSEAISLGQQVKQGRLTKVQAAQKLNVFRIKHIGRNTVDDSVYDVYLRLAARSQSEQISAEESKLYLRSELEGWQKRWQYMDDKPSNPAFANFLFEQFGMKPLQ